MQSSPLPNGSDDSRVRVAFMNIEKLRPGEWAQLAKAALTASKETLRAAARRGGRMERELYEAADYVEAVIDQFPAPQKVSA